MVGDVLQDGLDSAPPVQIFVPHTQAVAYATFATRSLVMAARTEGPVPDLVGAFRTAVWKLDPDLAVAELRTMESILWDSVARPRFVAMLLGLLAGLAMLLAAVGVYSVVSYGVARRTREFGIRLAIGARPREVSRMVIAQSLRPAAAGLLIGVATALLTGRLLAALLFRTSSRDPLTLGLVAVLMLTVAAFAAWLPARRIGSIEAMEALAED